MNESHPQDPSHGDDPESTLIAEVLEVFGDIVEHERRIGPRWRRIVRALHGLGLLDIVDRNWVRITPDGLAFADLTAEAADRLARRLEDIESGQPVTPSTTPPPDHPRFEFPRPVNPPTTGINPHHLGVWR